MVERRIRLVAISVAAVALSLGTILLFVGFSGYRAIGEDLVRGGDFEATQFWRLSQSLRENENLIQDGAIQLNARWPGESLLARQLLTIPASRQLLVIAKGVEINVVDAGKLAVGAPTIALIGRDPSGQLVGGFDNIVVRDSRARKITEISQYVKIPDEFTELWLELEIDGVAGVLRVDQVQAFEAREIVWVGLARDAVGVMWIALAAISGFLLWQVLRSAFYGLIAVFVLTVVIPAPWKHGFSGNFYAMGSTLVDAGLDHGILFFFATIVSYGLFPESKYWAIVMSWVAVATATESLQSYTDTRDPLFSDWMANILGVAVATIVTMIYRLCCSSKTSTKTG